jgi:hypothetical protein
MPSTRILSSAGLLLALSAWGHPQGFHKKLTFTLTKTKVSGLIVMDVDAGERCLLLREPADSNRDGVLTGEEVTKLKERLVKLATRPLKVGFSGATLPLVVKDSKLSLRSDQRANDSGLSLAILVELELARAPTSGMHFEVEDVSPDQSAIVVQVFQEGADAPQFEAEVPSGALTRVRLSLPAAGSNAPRRTE